MRISPYKKARQRHCNRKELGIVYNLTKSQCDKSMRGRGGRDEAGGWAAIRTCKILAHGKEYFNFILSIMESHFG